MRLQILGDCVIEVNGTRVDPGSTHLFALLLILALETDRRVHRTELQRMLFAADVEPQQASHNLRQLLYRVRRLGVELDENAAGLSLSQATEASLAQSLSSLMTGECEGVSATSLAFLPSYSPRLPNPFLEWLDRQRDIAEHTIRASLLTASVRLREAHAWISAYRTSSTLASIDPMNEDAVAVAAESLAMLGRRHDALALINSFNGVDRHPSPSVSRLRPLHTRIARLGEIKAHGVLRGRTECLAGLEAEWEKLGPEGARRAALIGPAGIGKTRVAEAFAERVRLLGGHVTRYTCDAASSEQPLGLFADILPELRSLRGSIGASPDFATALDRLRPVAAPSESPVSSDISVEAVRSELQRALIDLLEAVSEERPLLLVVDDAHFLDSVSANVVRSLCGKENSARVLVLLCVRRSHAEGPLLEPARRATSYLLEPLPAHIGRQVVLDIAGPHIAESHLEWCLAQAAGNPFYLHTLASQRFADSTLVPFDIRSLAANAYSCLASATRTVLESCLLLGRLASLNRVRTVSGVSELELLSAVRELETLDLLTYADGVLAGPHALLQDALLSLIPSAVAALLHARIARVLEAEGEAEQYTFPVAWAGAQSWLAAGDPQAAARLIRKCARQAAQIGEPKVAIELLSRVVDAKLPTALHAEVLDELVEYAEASAAPAILVSAATARLKLAKALGDSGATLREFERRIIEADVKAKVHVPGAVDSLLALLIDKSNTPFTRARAAERLLVLADQDLDTVLAGRVAGYLPTIPRGGRDILTVCLRAEVVFHTFCGDASIARSLAFELLRFFPKPTLKHECIRARSFAAYALQRIYDDQAACILAESYEWLSRHGLHREAHYCTSGLTSIALRLGDFPCAKEWLLKSKLALGGESPHSLSPESGVYADEAFIAMHEGRYADAEPLIFAPAKDFSTIATVRHKSVSLAMWIRLKQLRGDPMDYPAQVAELEQLFTRGQSLGGQDIVVEALWSARILAGDATNASQFLSNYLETRRERGAPEWSLLHTTLADPAWQLTEWIA